VRGWRSELAPELLAVAGDRDVRDEVGPRSRRATPELRERGERQTRRGWGKHGVGGATSARGEVGAASVYGAEELGSVGYAEAAVEAG
jgi:hypothetical protein